MCACVSSFPVDCQTCADTDTCKKTPMHISSEVSSALLNRAYSQVSAWLDCSLHVLIPSQMYVSLWVMEEA